MAAGLISYPTNVLPAFLEKYINMPTLISLLTIFQGCFGGMGIIKVPQRLQDAVSNPVMRLVFVSLISYTATQDIETALITSLIFLGVMHLLRTSEEREELGFLW